jgi:hypothetical protein
LLLLIFVRTGAATSRPAAGTREIKRPPELLSGTAGDYSTAFDADCKDCQNNLLAILLSQRDGKRKEKKRGPGVCLKVKLQLLQIHGSAHTRTVEPSTAR